MKYIGEQRNIRNFWDVKQALSDIWRAIRGNADSIPAGFICAGVWPECIDPPGWLYCNGRKNLGTAAYPRLYKVVSTIYGSDGDGMFGIPDMRGRFLMGAAVDPSGTDRVGTYSSKLDSGTAHLIGIVNWYIRT